ncbi:MAG: RsmB/NOP family class I SAM-dependent RNA methyltransferase, partial [Bacteroidales bacterium]|nr:RsmB/NOP family class I SAM-dependent RNA methyltransferase [Bacteroidales bacterium]
MFDLPQTFIDNTRSTIGTVAAGKVFDAIKEGSPTVSVRANLSKITAAGLAAHFSPISTETVPWCSEGLYLDTRPSFAEDPLMHQGAYYVQDASSMIVQPVLKSMRREMAGTLRVLDLCAAPGGKSTAALSALGSGDLLVTNEVIKSRATVLAENIVKWGMANAVVTSCDPSQFQKLKGYFDVIMADVPCSGEGMFRKAPESILQWSADNVNLCAARQRRIVSDAWSSLKGGGYLIYSTCTLNKFENDDNVQWICSELGAEVVPLENVTDVGCTAAISTRCGLQFAPGITRGEGLYVALLRKTEPVSRLALTAKGVKKYQSFQGCDWTKDDIVPLKWERNGETLIKGYPVQIMDEIL